jgi:heme-degrading monooxygenase HmoA
VAPAEKIIRLAVYRTTWPKKEFALRSHGLEKPLLLRDSHLDKVPGFIEFHLLKGPEAEDHTLYASHTVWENRAVFEAWTKSEAFRAAHSRAADNKPLYLDHPQFEGFEVRQTVVRGKAAP